MSVFTKQRSRWSLADFADFEFLIAAEQGNGPVDLDTERKAAESLPEDACQRERLRCWLDMKRGLAAEGLPGAWVGRADRILFWIFVFVGLISGFAAAQAVLLYNGREAINVLACFALLVALPFMASVISVVFLFIRKPIGRGVQTLWYRGLRLILGSGGRLNTGDWSAVHLALTRGSGYTSIFSKRVRLGVMGYALALQLAIFLTLLFSGMTAQLGFGWQSSLNIEAATVAENVQIVARPWAWAPRAVPSEEQILGSRVSPHLGISELSGSDLDAWWPFFCYATLFYGVLPRVLLFIFAALTSRRSMNRHSFDDFASREVARRMSVRPRARIVAGAAGGNADATTGSVESDIHSGERFSLVLRRSTLASVDSLLGHWPKPQRIYLDLLDDRTLWQEQLQGDVLLLVESWRPFLEATREYIEVLLEDVGSSRGVCVALCPMVIDKGLGPIDDAARDAWYQRLTEMHAANLHWSTLEELLHEQ